MENVGLFVAFLVGIGVGIIATLLFQTALKMQTATMTTVLSQQYGSLDQQLRTLTTTTDKLTKTLANETQRGLWGQDIADGILVGAGFTKNTDYYEQRQIANKADEDGSPLHPDFTFILPNALHIHMDSKFPWNNFEKLISTPELDSAERERYRKSFVSNVKTHIKKTGKYIGDGTLDCAIMFIPNEALFHWLSGEPEIRRHALQCKVVICSPMSLLLVITMVRQACNAFALEKSLVEIRSEAQKLIDGLNSYADEFDKVETGLNKLRLTLEDLRANRPTRLKDSARKLDGLIADRPTLLEQGD